jgi:predicted GIY-YIG superfamily endonuclease
VGSNPTLSASLRQGYGWQARFTTKNRTPLRLEAYFAVKDKSRAIELEQYLKTGSGKAFLQKRIL